MNCASLSRKAKVNKQDILHIYNRLIKELYGSGISRHNIEISGDRLMLFAEHNRIDALKLLRRSHPELVAYTNTAIFIDFKEKLKKELDIATGLKITSILMDYDADTRKSCTIIYFNEQIC